MINVCSAAGYTHHEPVIIGLDVAGEQTIVAQGCPQGTVFYAASLGKQVTAACAAIACTRGQLDVEQPISRWLPELPEWADRVKVRHLIHHIGAIPRPEPSSYTNQGILATLAQFHRLNGTPGTDYRYSSAGYSLLGSIVMRAVEESLVTWADREIFTPLGLHDTCFWTGPQLAPPGVTARIPAAPAPHAIGPGGMWTTAGDLLRWNRGLATNALGVSALMHRPGHFDNGAPVDYAWGIGIRVHRGQRVYLHGGNLGTVNAKLVRWHDSTDSVLVVALDDATDRWLALADSLMDQVATNRTVCDPTT